MSIYQKKSRYAKSETYVTRKPDGTDITVSETPPPPLQKLLGIHLRKQGQRIDHLAYKYLKDTAGFWRIAHHNEVMTAEVLTEKRDIQIPGEAK